MRRFTLLAAGVVLAAATTATAQGTPPDSTKKAPAAAANLEGTWTGSLTTPQGEMPVNAKIKKEKDGYVGTVSGLEGDVPLKEITVVGDKVTMGAVMSMQGQSFEVWYAFVIKGDALNGSLSANVQGQSMAFDLLLKRAP